MIKETKDGLILSVKISPNSSKNEIIKTDGQPKIKLTAQPVEGKANKALIEFLSKELKIPKTSFEIIKGSTSKEKTICIKIFDNEKIQFVKKYLYS